MKRLNTALISYFCLCVLVTAVLLFLCACTSENGDAATVGETAPDAVEDTAVSITEPLTEDVDAEESTLEETVGADTHGDATAEIVTDAKETEMKMFTWENPVKYNQNDGVDHVRDPFILKVGDVWYMTGTLPPYGDRPNEADRSKGVPLYKSDDLIEWTFIDYILKRPAESEGKWYCDRFWAPEIFAYNGKYYVTVNCCRADTSNHGFLFAVSENIEGPYTVMNDTAPLVINNDAHLFRDDDGQVYLFGSGIWMAKIDLENLELLSSPRYIISPVPNSDAWNAERPRVAFEGPYVLKHEGKYYCFYSTWARGYEIGVAVAEDINGPWVMYKDPMYGAMSHDWCNNYGGIYQDGYYLNQDKYREAGHNSVFEGPDGKLWIAAHVTGGGVVTEGVEMVIDRLVFDDEHGLLAIDPKTGDKILGPTYGSQTVTYNSAEVEPSAVKALNVHAYTTVGSEYTLPDKVDILMDNGFRRTVKVVWESAADTSRVGVNVVKGVATLYIEYSESGYTSVEGQEYPVEAYIHVKASTVGTVVDFEDAVVGTHDIGGVFADIWKVKFTAYDIYDVIEREPAVIAEEDGNKFLRNTAYALWGVDGSSISGNYSFSLDLRLLSASMVGGAVEQLGGIAVRSADQSLMSHWDEDPTRSIGASGLIVIPRNGGYKVDIKTYEAGAVSSQSFYFRTSVNKGFNNIEIIDEGNLITLKANGELICTVEMGDEGAYDGVVGSFCRRAVVKDADGNAVIEVDNAFLTTAKDIHIVARGLTSFDIDNLLIKSID